MTELENYLSGYSAHIRTIKRLENELRSAKDIYNNAVGLSPPVLTLVKTDTKRIHKPTEDAAIALVHSLGAEVERVKRLLQTERLELMAIENLVNASALNGREREYVILKYYEGRSNEYMSGKMYCSVKTLGRTREGLLKKIETIYKKKRGCS